MRTWSELIVFHHTQRKEHHDVHVDLSRSASMTERCYSVILLKITQPLKMAAKIDILIKNFEKQYVYSFHMYILFKKHFSITKYLMESGRLSTVFKKPRWCCANLKMVLHISSYLRWSDACQDYVVKHEICWAREWLRHKPLELKRSDAFLQTPLREQHEWVLQAGIDVVVGEAPSPCRCMCAQKLCLKTW
jgi:hypothetical protein